MADLGFKDRHVAALLDGVGSCGMQLCCCSMCPALEPLPPRISREQEAANSALQVAGACGRLKCCLAYEQPAYEYLSGITPGVTSYVHTPDGDGTVCEVNLISGSIKVRLDNAPELPKTYTREEVTVLRAATRKGASKRRVTADSLRRAAPGGAQSGEHRAAAEAEHRAPRPAGPANAAAPQFAAPAPVLAPAAEAPDLEPESAAAPAGAQNGEHPRRRRRGRRGGKKNGGGQGGQGGQSAAPGGAPAGE